MYPKWLSGVSVPLPPPSGGPQVPAGAVVRVVHAHLIPAVSHPAGDRLGHAAVPRDGRVGPRDGDALLPHRARLAAGTGGPCFCFNGIRDFCFSKCCQHVFLQREQNEFQRGLDSSFIYLFISLFIITSSPVAPVGFPQGPGGRLNPVMAQATFMLVSVILKNSRWQRGYSNWCCPWCCGCAGSTRNHSATACPN